MTYFPPDDPFTERVRAICMSYPEAVEVLSHGRCTFRAGKRQFALVGVYDEAAVVFIPDPLERPVLLERDDVFVPPYEGALRMARDPRRLPLQVTGSCSPS